MSKKKLKAEVKELQSRIMNNLTEHTVLVEITVRTLSADEAMDLVDKELLANPTFEEVNIKESW